MTVTIRATLTPQPPPPRNDLREPYGDQYPPRKQAHWRPRQAQARRDRRRHRSQEPHPGKSVHPARRQRQDRTRRRHRTLRRQVSRRPCLRRSHGRGNPSPRRAREGRRTHRLPVLVLAQAMPRKSHHRRNQSDGSNKVGNQISKSSRCVPCFILTLRPVNSACSLVKSASRQASTLLPSAIRTIIGSTQQRSTASSTAWRAALSFALHHCIEAHPGKEQRHDRQPSPMPQVAMRTDDAALSVRRSAIEGTLPQAPSTFGPGSPQPIDRPSVGRARSPHRRPRRRNSPSPARSSPPVDHPFDPTPLGFAFSTRRLQQRLEIAERLQNSSCPVSSIAFRSARTN